MSVTHWVVAFHPVGTKPYVGVGVADVDVVVECTIETVVEVEDTEVDFPVTVLLNTVNR